MSTLAVELRDRHAEVSAVLRDRVAKVLPHLAGLRAVNPSLIYRALSRRKGADLSWVHAAADLAASDDLIAGMTGDYCPPAERGWAGWPDWCARRAVLYLESAEQHLGLRRLTPDYQERRQAALNARWLRQGQEVAA